MRTGIPCLDKTGDPDPTIMGYTNDTAFAVVIFIHAAEKAYFISLYSHQRRDMSLLPTTSHGSSARSWPSRRRRRLDEEQGSFEEFSDEDDTIAIAIPSSIEIEQQDAPQIQAAAPQNSWNNAMPLNERELGSAIMSSAVPIILGVAQLLIGLHLFGVF